MLYMSMQLQLLQLEFSFECGSKQQAFTCGT